MFGLGKLGGSELNFSSDIDPIFAYAESGQNAGERSLDNSLNAGSLWIGADTPIGPMYLSYGRAEGDRDSLYFVIGNVLK